MKRFDLSDDMVGMSSNCFLFLVLQEHYCNVFETNENVLFTVHSSSK